MTTFSQDTASRNKTIRKDMSPRVPTSSNRFADTPDAYCLGESILFNYESRRRAFESISAWDSKEVATS